MQNGPDSESPPLADESTTPSNDSPSLLQEMTSSVEETTPNNLSTTTKPQLKKSQYTFSKSVNDSRIMCGWFERHFVFVLNYPRVVETSSSTSTTNTTDAPSFDVSDVQPDESSQQTKDDNLIQLNGFSVESQIDNKSSAAFLILEEYIIRFGGLDENSHPTNDVAFLSSQMVDQIDDQGYQFQPLKCWGDTPPKRSHHTVVAIDVELDQIFDDSTQSEDESILEQSKSINLNSYLLIFGGKNAENEPLDDMYVLNLKTFQWKCISDSTKGRSPSARIGHSAVVQKGSSVVIYGGCNVDETEYYQDICELDLRSLRWKRIPIKLPHPSAFHTVLNVYGQSCMYGGRNANIIHPRLWFCQYNPKHNVFITHTTLSKDLVFNILDFNDSFNGIYNKFLHFNTKEAIKLKDEFVKEIINEEIDLYFYDTNMETLNSTCMLKFAFETLRDFPLFAPTKEKKTGFFSSLFGRKKEREVQQIHDLFLKLPPLLVKIEKTFKSPIVKEFREMFRGVFSFVVATPWDPKFVDYINDPTETESSFVQFNEEDMNFIRALMNLDAPLAVYNTLREAKNLDSLPPNYQHVFFLVREKVSDWFRFDTFTPGLAQKLKWLRRVLYILRPIVATMNPMTIASKMINIFLFSNLGKYGINLTLEVDKTEKQIKKCRENIESKQLEALNRFIQGKTYEQMEAIAFQYRKHDVPTHTKPKTTSVEEEEVLDEQVQDQIMDALRLPKSAKRILFHVPSPVVLKKKKSTKEKIAEKLGKKKRAKEEKDKKKKEKLDKKKQESEEPPYIEKFQRFLKEDINQQNEELNSKLNDEKIAMCMKYFDLNTRLLEKRDFLQAINQANIQQMFKDVLEIVMPLLFKLYEHNDPSKVLSSVTDLLGVYIKMIQEDTKFRKAISKKKKKYMSNRPSTPTNSPSRSRTSSNASTSSTGRTRTPSNPETPKRKLSYPESPSIQSSLTIDSGRRGDNGPESVPQTPQSEDPEDDLGDADIDVEIPSIDMNPNLTEEDLQDEIIIQDFEEPIENLLSGIEDFPEKARMEIIQLEESRLKSLDERRDVLFARFERHFFNHLNDSMNKDFRHNGPIHSVTKWISGIVAKMDDKTINVQEIYYKEKDRQVQKRLFKREVQTVLSDSLSSSNEDEGQ